MSEIVFPPYPLPVVTPLGDGYVVYIKCNGMYENDEVCVALREEGQWRHFNTSQIKMYHNGTYDIVNHPKQ